MCNKIELRDTKWLAGRLGLSVSTIEKLRAMKSIAIPKCITINRSVRYDEAYVERWISTKFEDHITLDGGVQ